MTTKRPIVWDVFPFHNETLLLEVRRRELRDERFDVRHLPVEANMTLTGQPRDWVLADSLKLVLPPPAADWTSVEREDAMREATNWALALVRAEPDDYVLFGDVDEIPHGGAIEAAMSTPGVKCLRLPYHSLLATWRLPLADDVWNFRWPLIGRLAEFDAADGDWAAMRAESGAFPRIDHAGWHLSSMGGPALVLDKVAAFAHAGEPWTEGLDAERLRDLVRRGRDVADRFTQEPCLVWELPFALIEDPARFRPLLEVCW